MKRTFALLGVLLIAITLLAGSSANASSNLQTNTTEEQKRLYGVCGLNPGPTGAVNYFMQIPEDEAPPPPRERIWKADNDDFPFVIVDSLVPLKNGTPMHSDCDDIPLREGHVWIVRGVVPRGRGGGDGLW